MGSDDTEIPGNQRSVAEAAVKSLAEYEAAVLALDLDAPKVQAPELATPELDAPELEASEMEASEVAALGLQAPGLQAPGVELPEVLAPRVESVAEEAVSVPEMPLSEGQPMAVMPESAPEFELEEFELSKLSELFMWRFALLLRPRLLWRQDRLVAPVGDQVVVVLPAQERRRLRRLPWRQVGVGLAYTR